MRNKPMPKVNMEFFADLQEWEQAIVSKIVKADGSIRATKPNVEKVVVRHIRHETQYGPYDEPIYDCADPVQGKAAYVWRHVVFFVSPKSAHQCMPTTDICDLPDEVTDDGFTMANPKIKALHDLVDKIVDAIPVTEWNGVRRWGQALGKIGEPVMRENGTIVYR